jgi:Protein of unknown function (DUF2809)
MAPESRVRAVYVAAALATIAVGLAVHLGATRMPPAIRDVLGDALWALMLTWWVGALWPRLGRGARAGISLGTCWAVELSQLCHTPGLDAVRRTTLGQLTLGSGFDPRDLGSYALGVLAALLVERAVASREPTGG